MNKSRSFRPRLETLEGRCLPSTWTGGAGDGLWESAGNWAGNVPNSIADFANFPAALGAITVKCNTARFGGLQVNDALTLKLECPVEIKGGGTADGCGNVNLNGGAASSIQADVGVAAADLTLNDIGGADDRGGGSYWTAGTIGNGNVSTNLKLTGGTTLVLNGSTPTIYGNVSLGTGNAETTANEMRLNQATLTLKGGSGITAYSASQLTISFPGGGGGSIIQDDGTAANFSLVDVYGKFVVGVSKDSTQVESESVPVLVESGGYVGVLSDNKLTITNGASSAYTYAMRVLGSPTAGAGKVKLGEQNPTDSRLGYSTLSAPNQGINVAGYGEMDIIAGGNTVNTVGGKGDSNNLSFDGTLVMYCNQTNDPTVTWYPAALTVTNGDPDFHSTGVYSLWVFDNRAGDRSVVSVAGTGNINTQTGCRIAPNKAGTLGVFNRWLGVLKNTGTGIVGGPGFGNSADGNWQPSYAGNPTTSMGVDYIGH